jgi:hypothetical protein
LFHQNSITCHCSTFFLISTDAILSYI